MQALAVALSHRRGIWGLFAWLPYRGEMLPFPDGKHVRTFGGQDDSLFVSLPGCPVIDEYIPRSVVVILAIPCIFITHVNRTHFPL